MKLFYNAWQKKYCNEFREAICYQSVYGIVMSKECYYIERLQLSSRINSVN